MKAITKKYQAIVSENDGTDKLIVDGETYMKEPDGSDIDVLLKPYDLQ